MTSDFVLALPYARPGRKSASSTAFDQFRDFKKETGLFYKTLNLFFILTFLKYISIAKEENNC